MTPEFLLNLLFYIIITPVISLTLTRIMYMSENKMVVADALARIDSVLEAAPMQAQAVPQHPQDASVALQNVHFSYDGKNGCYQGRFAGDSAGTDCGFCRSFRRRKIYAGKPCLPVL